MPDYIYGNMLVKLKTMDEKQLLELFHDLESIEAVQRICDVAYHFTQNFDYEGEGTCRAACEPSLHAMDAKPYLGGVSDEQDAIDVDNARLAREFR